MGLPGQCPGQMSLRAGGGEGPSAGTQEGGPPAACSGSFGPQQLNGARPVSLSGAPGRPRVGSGIAEAQSRRRLYLRRRLEALQPELRPPPAPRLEREEAPPAPSPLAFPFPAGACRRGFLRRGPHPSAPPSASQRLALDAAIFAQAASAAHLRACVAAAPAVTRPGQLTAVLPPCAPPSGSQCPLPLRSILRLPGNAACAPPAVPPLGKYACAERKALAKSALGQTGHAPLARSGRSRPPGTGALARGATPLILSPASSGYWNSGREGACRPVLDFSVLAHPRSHWEPQCTSPV